MQIAMNVKPTTMNIMTDSPAVATSGTDDLWYKDAIIYQLHVKAFADSNDDGVGDFNGLTQKLDYLQDLGVGTLWLQPFYPSPGRDDGYDIADYGSVNPSFGTMKDFRRFMHEAKRRGLRVITELVINHTSDQHPWFKRARRSSPGTSARDWYVWSNTDQRYTGTRIIFTDTEKSNWAWDQEAGAYYWHRFFSHQPDLNFDNPRVLDAITRVMKRWLDAGVDGFRLDAIPYLVEREGTNNENLRETHAVIKQIRAALDSYAPGKVLLAEANQWPEDVNAYFGIGDECHMAYHFPLMPRIYMAIAQEDRFPITDILRQTPDIPQNCQWAMFLRNHDELTLEMVTDSERDYLWSTYASDPRARLNLGIRRRLAPLMDNDRRKIELMNSLLFSMPGTPIIYYGDEIGMGDNIYLGDRNGVRTPMQWTPDRNGGFSRCDPAKLFLPPIMDPVYGYQAVNVEAQSRSLSSMLNWMKRLIAVRKTSQVFGRGSIAFLKPSNRSVLVYLRQYGDEVILCVANLARTAQSVEIDLSAWKGRVPQEMLGRSKFQKIGDAPFVVTLTPYGFFWFLLEEDTGTPIEVINIPEWITLVCGDGSNSLLEGHSLRLLEREVLPPFLTTRRWFADRSSRINRATVSASIPLSQGNPGPFLTIVDVESSRESGRYVLPLAVNWQRVERRTHHEMATLLAPVRRGSREGALVDAVADRALVAWMIDSIHRNATVTADGRQLEFRATDRFLRENEFAPVTEVHPVGAEQSNSTVIIDDQYALKIYRRLSDGLNPEVEIGRFLTDVAGYANTPPLLGTIDLVEGEQRSTVGILHGFVNNQGDAWENTAAYLDRFLEEERLLAPDAPREPDRHGGLVNRTRLAGRRTAEMHLALASRDDIPAFAPEPITAADITSWTDDLVTAANAMFDQMARSASSLDPKFSDMVERLISRRDDALERMKHLLPPKIDAVKIRHHGDFHLGQLLVVGDDVFIIDFEGEPNRPEAERRRKAPAARDIAGFVRSLDYATTSALDRMVAASAEEFERLSRTIGDLRKAATEVFLGAMRERLAQSKLWPEDPSVSEQLLNFFMVEKAVYEIGYELNHRPDWLRVPVAGLERILFGPDEGGAA